MNPREVRPVNLLRDAHAHLARYLRRRGRLAEAEQAGRNALELARRQSETSPDAAASRSHLPATRHFLGRLLDDLGHGREAEAQARAEVAEWRQLSAASPNWPYYLRHLAHAQARLGRLLLARGRAQEGLAQLSQAWQIAVRLAKEHPSGAVHAQLLGVVGDQLGSSLRPQGRLAEAEAAHRAALKAWDGLVSRHPDQGTYRYGRGRCACALGAVRKDRGRLDEAERWVRRGLRDLEAVAAGDDLTVRRDLAACLLDLAQIVRLGRRYGEASRLTDRARGVLEKALAEGPGLLALRDALALCLACRSENARVQGRHAEAEEARRQALAVEVGLARDHPEVSRYPLLVGTSHNVLGMLAHAAGRFEQSEKEFAQARAVLEKLVAGDPLLVSARAELGGALHNLSVLMRRRKDWDGSLALLDLALAQQRAALKASPLHASARSFLANHLTHQAQIHRLRGDHARAATAARALAAEGPDRWTTHFEVARILSGCVPLAAGGHRELAERYAAEAVRSLRKAVERGYRNLAVLKAGATFQPIRSRADFRQLLAQMQSAAGASENR